MGMTRDEKRKHMETLLLAAARLGGDSNGYVPTGPNTQFEGILNLAMLVVAAAEPFKLADLFDFDSYAIKAQQRHSGPNVSLAKLFGTTEAPPTVRKEDMEHRPRPEDVIADDVRRQEQEHIASVVRESGSCGYAQAADGAHIHQCEKTPGHADGPGGSDHQCQECGQLYQTAGADGSAEFSGDEEIEL